MALSRRWAPAALLDWLRRGLGLAWIWVAVSLSLGFNAWHPTHYPILHAGTGLRVPWREVAWLPVWSPLPSGSMSWLLLPLGLGGIGLLLNYRPRLWASLIALCWLWLMGLDQFLFLYHRYFLLGLTGAVLLLPPRRQRRVSLWACLPLLVLCGAVWFWSGWAKFTPLWFSGAHLYYDLTQLTAPRPAAFFARWPPAGIWLLSIGYLLAELLMAYLLLRPRSARQAAWVALPLAGTLALLAPIFAVATATASWVTGQCVWHLGQRRPLDQAPLPPVPRWRMAAILLFCAAQLLLPLRPYFLSAASYDTGLGLRWAWRQMAVLREEGPLHIELWEPAQGWVDIMPALAAQHAQIYNHLSLFPCEIPWAVAWLQRTRPDLLDPDQPLRFRYPGYAPGQLPGACPARPV